jgi:RIO-like serine/threonine protein kinase
LQTFREGGYGRKPLYVNHELGRYVYIIETAGRKLVVKHIERYEECLEKSFYEIFTGDSRYQRILRLTVKAVDKGCTAVQDVFLVAERKISFTTKEIFIVAEYVEGGMIGDDSEKQLKYRRQVLGFLREIHSFGLASSDFNFANIIITPENQLRMIDIYVTTD